MNNLSACADFFDIIGGGISGEIFYNEEEEDMRLEIENEYSTIDIPIRKDFVKLILSQICDKYSKSTNF